MRKLLPVRLLAVTALVGSASLAVMIPGGIASAKTAKPTKVTCTGLSGNESTQTLSGCSDAAVTGGGGVSNVSTSTVTWNTTGLTSVESYTIKTYAGKKDKCTAPVGLTNSLEIKEAGSVTGGTATTLVGGKLKATVCVFSDGSVANFPGTTLSF